MLPSAEVIGIKGATIPQKIEPFITGPNRDPSCQPTVVLKSHLQLLWTLGRSLSIHDKEFFLKITKQFFKNYFYTTLAGVNVWVCESKNQPRGRKANWRIYKLASIHHSNKQANYLLIEGT